MEKTKNALVLGGTRYLGRHLVEDLLKKGISVTIANRGTTPDTFGDRVQRIKFAREDRNTFTKSFGKTNWDLVFDQICFSPSEAEITCEFFADRTQRYILTSTQSVYITNGLQKEEDFDPTQYPIKMGFRSDFNYGEAKRLAEAVFFQKAKFPVVAIRLPFVLGEDDYTNRLEFHIARIRDGKPFIVPDSTVLTSVIQSHEAGRFISWMAETNMTGPINACSLGELTVGQLIIMIEKELGRKAIIFPNGDSNELSPYAGVVSRYLDPSRAMQLGYSFSNLKEWLPNLIRVVANRLP